MKKLLKFTVIAIGCMAAGSTSSYAAEAPTELPKYRPLVEEFTGLWCGACPAGWVALEEARDNYGDEFTFITYHLNDILTSSVTPPVSVSYVPSMSLNRAPAIEVGGLDEYLSENVDQPANAGLDVRLEWRDEDKTELDCTTTVYFVDEEKDTNYSLVTILVADGLSNRSWAQTNYYAGQSTISYGKYWDIFTKGGVYVYGLEYNGVAAIRNRNAEASTQIPADIESGESFSMTETFRMADGRSVQNVNLVADRDNLRVVAILMDKDTRRAVNSISSRPTSEAGTAGEDSGVAGIDDNEKIPLRIEYFNLQGRRLPAPEPGQPCIVITTYSDASIDTRKILLP